LFAGDFQDGRLTGTPRQLTHDHDTKGSPIWTHDGREIIYIAGQVNSSLSICRVAASGGEVRKMEGIGANALRLTLATKANRLLYSTAVVNYDLRRLDLNAGPDAKPERFISSTRYEVAGTYSPDGAKIAFSSNRSGVRQIWVADSDGKNITQLTSFASGIAGSPRWSPDGQTIAFDARPQGQADVYTIAAAGGSVKRLTDFAGEDHVPTWSPDGQFIYFGSARAGHHEIFRMHADGSGVEQITRNAGEFGMVSPDGKWLYYSVQQKGIWKMPAAGGEATQFIPEADVVSTQLWTLRNKGIDLFGRGAGGILPVLYSPLEGGAAKIVARVNSGVGIFPDVSPDGRWWLYTSLDPPVFEIMQVDHFR